MKFLVESLGSFVEAIFIVKDHSCVFVLVFLILHCFRPFNGSCYAFFGFHFAATHVSSLFNLHSESGTVLKQNILLLIFWH